MKLINLSENVYRNYANIHSRRNFGQTIEYAYLETNIHKQRLFLGLIDENNNIHAASLILIHNVSTTVTEAIAPNGFLIDYANYALVKAFNELLIKRLKKEKVTYLITNPMFKYHVINKKNMIILNNENILNNLYMLGYDSIGYYSDFEKYDVIIENDISTHDIYRNFNRNTKRNINEATKLGINLRKGTINDIEEAYNIFKKKTTKSLDYYRNLMNIYNNKDNKMELFFASLNPHKYLVNIQKLYEKEKKKNEKIHLIFERHIGNISDRLLNRKINSDKTVEKYRNELNNAIKISQKYNTDIVIGTVIVIKNNHEIYFLIDGYKEEFRRIHTTHILKWAIIKKYFERGYHIFNLGEIHKDYYNKNSKYYGQYRYKIGFGGNIIEYTPNLMYVINKPLYNLYTKINRKKK